MKQIDFKNLDLAESQALMRELGLEPYRAQQIRNWVFQRLALSFEKMANLPKAVRVQLQDQVRIRSLEKVTVQKSRDGTEKYLFSLEDGLTIESVLIPEKGYFTLCISSQVGCRQGCRFCLTAKQGLKRDLTPAEIVEQVIHIKGALSDPERLTNIVLMGMGEPLANFEAVKKAVQNLVAADGMNFSHRKITLSTSGLVPEMERLGKELTINLAVSLNAADNETRSRLMPVNRKYPLEQLLAACKAFPLPNRRKITFEYILIAGENDADQDAQNLCKLLTGLRAKINLIPLNAHEGSKMKAPDPERVLAFQEILIHKHYTAMIRKSKGRDISAACGQLSGKYNPKK
ncbi:MAG: 23S rRNA (adenine(2503)-C(2))-methyltransferase RlmN [Desulfobacteraceae bacterium]|nr:MAG: 23S rRNA (adenine(2503)-C(2))-methyltransferase RlmN [Desulfobacteraceae bacterium]